MGKILFTLAVLATITSVGATYTSPLVVLLAMVSMWLYLRILDESVKRLTDDYVREMPQYRHLRNDLPDVRSDPIYGQTLDYCYASIAKMDNKNWVKITFYVLRTGGFSLWIGTSVSMLITTIILNEPAGWFNIAYASFGCIGWAMSSCVLPRRIAEYLRKDSASVSE